MRQPIETAPKDGSKILLFDPNWSEQFPDGAAGNWYAHPSVSAWVADEIDCNDYEFEPTHWMPLPAPQTMECPACRGTGNYGGVECEECWGKGRVTL